MRVLIERVREGVREFVVLAAPRARLAPIVLRGTDKRALLAELTPVLEGVALAEKLPDKASPGPAG